MSQRGKRKTAGTYSLISGTGVIKQVSKMYKALCKDTNQIWHAKVIDDNFVKQYGLFQHIDFNQEIFIHARDKQNIIYLKQIFQKNNNTFFIQQLYDQTLNQKVTKKCPLDNEQIQSILNDVVHGLIQLYTLRYYTRCLRPQNIVCVQNVWKIQSFVKNSQIFPIQSQFIWSGFYASPQDKYKNGKLEPEQQDEQIVWQIGMLGLYMLLGNRYQYDKIYKNQDIDWKHIRSIASDDLYLMINRSLETDPDQRIKLRDFLSLPIFKQIDVMAVMSAFDSQSKFFLPVKMSKTKKQKNLNEEDKKMWLNLRNDIERFKVFGQVDRYLQQIPLKNNFEMSLLRYLSFRISNQNLKKILQQSQKWVKYDINVHGIVQLDKWVKDLTIYLNQNEKLKMKYLKELRKNSSFKTQIPKIKQALQTQNLDETTEYSKILQFYWKVAGFIYTELSKQILKDNQNLQIQRTIIYYSICAYLAHKYEKQEFKQIQSYQVAGVIQIRRMISEAPIQELRKLSQQLVKNCFQISS